jgi:hypothetical protein
MCTDKTGEQCLTLNESYDKLSLTGQIQPHRNITQFVPIFLHEATVSGLLFDSTTVTEVDSEGCQHLKANEWIF